MTVNITYREMFLNRWQKAYPETAPINYLFKQKLTKRWARIHSLPESKRYPADKAEWEILLHRQNTVIDYMIPQNTHIEILFNRIDPDNYLFKSFNLVDIGIITPGDDEPGHHCFHTDTTWESKTLDPLLMMIAADEMRAFIIAPECLIAPYDGGMDVVLKDPHTCWELKRHFGKWLSKREDGL
jgi:hypothetical protein